MPQNVVGSVSEQGGRPCPCGAVHEGVRGQSVVSKAAPCSSVSDSVAVIRWEFIWGGRVSVSQVQSVFYPGRSWKYRSRVKE